MRRRERKPALADLDELLHVVGDAAARAAQREGRTDHGGEAHAALHFKRLGHAVGNARAGALKADLFHRLLEALAVLGLVNGVGRCADQFDAVLLEHALAGKIHREVERGLSAHRRQDGIGPFLVDDAFDHLPVKRLDVGCVRRLRIGHDGGRIGIDQNGAVALLAQRLASLRPGVVELAGLTNDDRTGAKNHDRLDVCTFWHG